MRAHRALRAAAVRVFVRRPSDSPTGRRRAGPRDDTVSRRRAGWPRRPRRRHVPISGIRSASRSVRTSRCGPPESRAVPARPAAGTPFRARPPAAPAPSTESRPNRLRPRRAARTPRRRRSGALGEIDPADRARAHRDRRRAGSHRRRGHCARRGSIRANTPRSRSGCRCPLLRRETRQASSRATGPMQHRSVRSTQTRRRTARP